MRFTAIIAAGLLAVAGAGYAGGFDDRIVAPPVIVTEPSPAPVGSLGLGSLGGGAAGVLLPLALIAAAASADDDEDDTPSETTE